MKEREKGFDLRFSYSRELPEYNALRDVNMRNYFESATVQKHLLETGQVNCKLHMLSLCHENCSDMMLAKCSLLQVDHFGRVVHSEKHRHRLHIIEKEVGRAERSQQLEIKDEADTRHLVRQERFRDIDKKQRLENVERRKTEMKTQMDLERIEREVMGCSHLYAGNHGMIVGNQHKYLEQSPSCS